MAEPVYRRVVVKVSGEALMGPGDYGIHQPTLERIASDLVAAQALGVAVGIVVGGGNIFRGVKVSEQGIPRVTGDLMGILATVMNALALESALEKAGVPARTMSALAMPEICETYERRRALRHLDEGRMVLLAAGTGNPFFTTDTAAALRALEIHAEAILMAKNGVEGVYDSDPATNPDAEFIAAISHREAIERGLKVMDSTALSLCMDNDLPIYVFNMADERNIDRIVSGERVGTLVSSKPATEPTPEVRS